MTRRQVTIDRTRQTAVFDFTGTGPEVYGNCNTPPAVTFSAIIYCLRCMVTRDIPLNQVRAPPPSLPPRKPGHPRHAST